MRPKQLLNSGSANPSSDFLLIPSEIIAVEFVRCLIQAPAKKRLGWRSEEDWRYKDVDSLHSGEQDVVELVLRAEDIGSTQHCRFDGVAHLHAPVLELVLVPASCHHLHRYVGMRKKWRSVGTTQEARIKWTGKASMSTLLTSLSTFFHI